VKSTLKSTYHLTGRNAVVGSNPLDLSDDDTSTIFSRSSRNFLLGAVKIQIMAILGNNTKHM
jgi:hypothetical protein